MNRTEYLKELLAQAKADEFACYAPRWQAETVQLLNECYYAHELWDEEICDLSSDLWDDVVERQLTERGWAGVKYFLAQVEPTDDYSSINGYGNAEAVHGDELVDRLEQALEQGWGEDE